MSGWLDLIGIGIDVAQSHQIYKAREELGQLQAGAQAEAARKVVPGFKPGHIRGKFLR